MLPGMVGCIGAQDLRHGHLYWADAFLYGRK